MRTRLIPLLVLFITLFMLSACTNNQPPSEQKMSSAAALKKIVVTHSILGSVVKELVGNKAEVTVLIPNGQDLHVWEPSAKDIETLYKADLVVLNGLELEASLTKTIQQAEKNGIPLFTATDYIDIRKVGEGELAEEHHHAGEAAEEHHHAGEAAEEHHHVGEAAEEHHHAGEATEEHHHAGEAAEEHHHAGEATEEHHHAGEAAEEHHHAGEAAEEHHHHEAGAPDPHFWTDPIAMKKVAVALNSTLQEKLNIDTSNEAASLNNKFDQLDQELSQMIEKVPTEDRKLVSGHESLGYFADRYGFKLIGAIIPSLTTEAEVSAADMANLKKVIQEQHVKAVFSELGTPKQLSEIIAHETGAKVIELNTHILPEDGSYFTFMRDLTQTIVKGLQ